jgi:hypothetical protein
VKLRQRGRYVETKLIIFVKNRKSMFDKTDFSMLLKRTKER